MKYPSLFATQDRNYKNVLPQDLLGSSLVLPCIPFVAGMYILQITKIKYLNKNNNSLFFLPLLFKKYKNCNKLKFLWNFSYMVHLFLRFRKSGTLENILGSSKCKVPWSFASWYQLTAQNPDVIPDTMTFPKQTTKKDFTNELIPKGKKVIPVTIKSIFRNIANLFKAPTSRRKKWYEPEITILFLKIFTENCSGTHIFG